MEGEGNWVSISLPIKNCLALRQFAINEEIFRKQAESNNSLKRKQQIRPKSVCPHSAYQSHTTYIYEQTYVYVYAILIVIFANHEQIF